MKNKAINFSLLLVVFAFWVCSGKPAGDSSQGDGPALQTVSDEPFVYSNKSELQLELAESRQTALTRAIQKVSPAVVGIHVTQIKSYAVNRGFDDPLWDLFFGRQMYRERVKSMGSGVLISPEGDIITNSHVVEDAVEIIVTLSGGGKYNATLIGNDNLTDIALLKIEGENLPWVETGNSDDILIGEWAVALGNPFGLFDVNNQPTATLGIISSTHLDFGEQSSGRVYQDMIQTDASINTGNSGGALVNILGELIGINTFIFTGGSRAGGSVGIGFAIPVNRVMEVVEELRDKGRVDRGFETGLSVQNIDRFLAAYLNLPNIAGIIITNVEKNSSAEKAGLMVGDVITEVNGTGIRNDRDIYRIINEGYLKAGDILNLKIWRNGDHIDRKLILETPGRSSDRN